MLSFKDFVSGQPLSDWRFSLPQANATKSAIKYNLYYSSTVVIWSGHIGSHEDHALLLGKDLRKDLVNQGTLG